MIKNCWLGCKEAAQTEQISLITVFFCLKKKQAFKLNEYFEMILSSLYIINPIMPDKIVHPNWENGVSFNFLIIMVAVCIFYGHQMVLTPTRSRDPV